MINLCVATPMYGGQCYGAFMEGIMALKDVAISKGWGFKFIYTTNESLITRARNKLVEQFLVSNSTHLLFLDADMVFNPSLVAGLVEYDVDVVCGVCPKKFIDWNAIKNLVTNNPDITPNWIPTLTSEYCVNYHSNYEHYSPSPTGLMLVKHAGTGCMLIKRQVLETMQNHLPKFTDYGSDGTANPKERALFFDTKVEEHSNAYLSEDYYFCNEWKKLGGNIYIAYGVKLKHIGIYTFG
jgi:hypothetical protein